MVSINRTINRMAQGAAVLTPTQVSDFVYCPRLFYLKKRYPSYGATTFGLAYGSFVHEIFRTFTTTCKTIWRKSSPSEIVTHSKGELENQLSEAMALAKIRYPVFYDKLEQKLLEFKFVVESWLQQKQTQIQQKIKAGLSNDNAVSEILPWKVEESLHSKEHNIFGRTDALYRENGIIIPEDIKTHNSKIATYVHMDSFKAQLLCYSIMAEEVFDIPSTKARVFFPNDLSSLIFNADKQARENLIEQIHSARDSLDQEIPPVLEGDKKILCQFCYCKQQCEAVAAEATDAIEKLTGVNN